MKKLLITGINGHIGKILAPALAKDYEVVGLDIEDADISDIISLKNFFAKTGKIDFVLHLAADSYPFASFDLVLKHNIIGTKNIYEVCRQHKIKRVVFASSTHAFGKHPGYPDKVSTESFRPDEWYGWSKAAGELIARMYFDLYSLSSAILRIGHVTGMGAPDPQLKNLEISPKELIDLTKKALVSKSGFATYLAISPFV